MKEQYAELSLQRVPQGWRIVTCSEAFLAMTGYTRALLRDRYQDLFTALLPAADLPAADRLAPCDSGGAPLYPWVFTLNLPEPGAVLPVLVQPLPAGQAGELCLRIHNASFWDEQLAKMSRRILSLEESVPSGLCQVLFDEHFTIIWHNQYFLEMLGYTEEQFAQELKYRGSGYVPLEERTRIAALLNEAVARGDRCFSVETQAIRRDKTMRTLLISMSFTDERINGVPVLYSMGIDITDRKRAEQFERDAERLHMAMDQASTYILEYDLSARRLSGAEGLKRYFALPDEVENVPDSLIESGAVAPASQASLRALFAQIAAGEERVEDTLCLKGRDGEERWLMFRLTLLYSGGARTGKALLLLEDITQRHCIELRFQEEENRRAAMTYDMDFSFQIDLTSGQIITANRPKFPFFDFDQSSSFEALLRRLAACRVHEEDRGEYLRSLRAEHMLEAFGQGVLENTLEFRGDDYGQGFRWYQGVVHLIREPSQGHVFAYLYTKDIDEEKRLALELRRRAEYDSLTGLYNRYTAERCCDQLLQAQKDGGLAVLYLLDLDHFKSLNDTCGHFQGDEMLQQCAACLRALFAPNALLGRLGGDELVVFQPDCPSLEAANQTAQGICDGIRALTAGGGIVTASVGLAFGPRDGQSFTQLYHCADDALHQAKHAGRNRWIAYRKDGAKSDVWRDAPPINWEWLLEESNDIVYVSDFYNYNLLYMNSGGRKTFGITDDSYIGEKCYKVLQQKDQPCEFCTNHLICREKFYCWEFRNHTVGRSLLLRDRIVDWHGVTARIEFATDVSMMDRRNQALEEQLEIDSAIISCLRVLNSAKSLDETALDMLEALAAFYGADRAYICDYLPRRDVLLPHFEWTRPGLRTCRQMIGAEGIEPSSSLRDCLQWRKDYLFERNDGPVAANLFEQLLYDSGVVCQRGVPFTISGKPAGLIGLDNPTAFRDEMTVLETLSYFISEELTRSRLSERLSFLSYHDSLTGLWNRNRYVEYIEELKSAQQIHTLGVAVADLNALKDINKLRGHTQGDHVVQRTADLLRECFPQAQIFRLSGDEFVVHCENWIRLDFLERINLVRDRAVNLEAHGISVGYAWTDNEFDCPALTMQATEIMILQKRAYYQSEQDGHTPGKHSNARLLELLDCLKAGKFEMFLQPKADCGGFRLNGAEALVRFRHTDEVIISPDRFIPTLEQEHTIKYVDLFIFEEVCKLLARWQAEGRALLPISLNFSRLTLLEPDLLKTMLQITARYGVPKDCIEVEITESLGEYNSSTIAEIGAGIKDSGFRLALDDFGSHYTNMAMLSAVPADVLKLDRSMVRDVMSSQPNRLVLKSVLSLCRDLGISCIAEGVETLQQFELLRSMRCDSIQGFLFGRPTCVAEFEQRYLLQMEPAQ